ncbi:MAG: hypothetical protein G8237_11580 [Magnetococcales bacterium]|nr:hypothetical protein [Magnetococcales bacterium]NGZ06985.1 hypothetical protein [Magnetococcales bacterium]
MKRHPAAGLANEHAENKEKSRLVGQAVRSNRLLHGTTQTKKTASESKDHSDAAQSIHCFSRPD